MNDNKNMNLSDRELLKKAINEALSRKFQRELDECDEEIVCSPAHMAAMKKIIYGTKEKNESRRFSPRVLKAVAILVAAAVLLASCAIAYRKEIRTFFENICMRFVAVTYSMGESNEIVLEEIYELSYLPEGYVLENEEITHIKTKYSFSNSAGNKISFEQRTLDTAGFFADIENGYTKVVGIDEYDLYVKTTKAYNHYIWNDGKYTLRLTVYDDLTVDELKMIVDGVQIEKQ